MLLIHPRREGIGVRTPHLGLGILAAILKKAGHEVTVFDELLLKRRMDLAAVIGREKPDAVGVTLYSALAGENAELIQEIAAQTRGQVPIVVGGPHATLFPEQLQSQLPVSYICTGECEGVVEKVFAEATVQKVPQIIPGAAADMRRVVAPDFTAFHDYRSNLTDYPLQTSRGCPFNCSFCDVRKLTGGPRWRARDIEACIAEVDEAVRQYPAMTTLVILDDCPTGNVGRFKQFLDLLIRRDYGLKLNVSNMRADHVDEELCRLLKRAGCRLICIGVEHADPEMFQSIGKGESLEDMSRAAGLIRKSGLQLGMCFVIGLPGDTYEKHLRSVAFAREHRPHVLYWNALVPYPGTRVREYFEKKGRFLPLESFSSFGDGDFRPAPVMVEDLGFPAEQRMKAQFVAILETSQYIIRSWRDLRDLFALAKRYGVPRRAVLRSLFGVVTRTMPRGWMNRLSLILIGWKRALSSPRKRNVN